MHELPDSTADATPKCLNCGEQVTQRYVDVFAPEEWEDRNAVRCCPNCTRVRRNGEVRQARGRGASYQDGEVADAKTDGGVRRGD